MIAMDAMADINVAWTAVWFIAVLVIPGAILGKFSGLNTVWSVAASIPLSAAVAGFAGWLFGQIGIRFGLAPLIAFWVLLCVVVFALRKLIESRQKVTSLAFMGPGLNGNPREWVSSWRNSNVAPGSVRDPVWVLPFVGVVAGASVIISTCVRFFDASRADGGHGIMNIYQGWDVHWHASMVRYAMDEGMADPTQMGPLRNLVSDHQLYYPSGWHALAATAAEVLGLHPIVAVNMMSVVAPAVMLPLGTALFTWRMVDNRTLLAQIAPGGAALAVSFAPSLFWTGYYIGAFPYVASVCMAFIVVSLFMTVPSVPVRGIAAGLSFGGLMMMHPSAVTIVLTILLVWWLTKLVFVPTYRVGTDSAVKARLRDFGVLAVTGAVACIVLLPQIIGGSSQTSEVQEFTFDQMDSRIESFLRVLSINESATDLFEDRNWVWVYFLAIVGGLVLVNWRHNFWAPLSLLALVCIAAEALKPFGGIVGSMLFAISSLHYSASPRLAMPVIIVMFAAVGVGLAAIIRTACLFFVTGKTAQRISAAASVILAVVLGGVLIAPMNHTIEEGTEATLAGAFRERMVTTDDRVGFEWLAHQPKARDGYILGDSEDGYGWMYAYNSLPSYSHHYHKSENLFDFDFGRTPEDPMGLVLDDPSKIGAGTPENPRAYTKFDAAVDELNVNYFFMSPPQYWWMNEPKKATTEEIFTAPGLTEVFRLGQTRILAVNAHFTDEELTRMRSESPEDLGTLTSYGAAGVPLPEDVVRDGDTNAWNYNYYPRPEQP